MDTKKINIPKFKATKFKKPNLQKDVFWAIIVSVLIFIGAIGYQFIKTPGKEVLELIKEENSSSNIYFDQKTIDEIKERQLPPESKQSSVGKNPFIPF